MWNRVSDHFTGIAIGAVALLLAVEVYIVPEMQAEAQAKQAVAVAQVEAQKMAAIAQVESEKTNAVTEANAKVPVLVVDGIDPGGQISTYYDWWMRVRNSGVRVVIDGACISACTMVLGIVPPDRVCYTPRARFGIHMATGQDGKPDPGGYEIYKHLFYPPIVLKWIAAHEPITEEVQFMMPDEMEGYIKPCTKEEYAAWASWLQQ